MTNQQENQNEDSKAYLVDPGARLFSRMAILPDTVNADKNTNDLSPPATAAIPQDNGQSEPPSLARENIINPKAFHDCYQVDKLLQHGAYGLVYEALVISDYKVPVDIFRNDGGSGNEKRLAVKVIDRTKLKERDDRGVFREVSILKELVDVPNVITLVDFFVETSTLYVVQELARGGDVFDRLIQRKTYTEEFARELAKVLLQTLKVIHTRGIVHRDLKPGNLLLASGSNDCDILLADFGFARHLPADGEGFCTTRCGTPMYVAPEVVLNVPYNTQADMWSCGCILYMLLSGYPAFHGTNGHRELFRRIRAGNYTFHEKSWGKVSVPAKQCIVNLMTVNPTKRWTAEQALDSTWMKNTTPADLSLSENDLSEVLSRIRSRRKLKAAMDAVRWATTAKFWDSDKVSFNHQHIEEHKSHGSANTSASVASTVAPKTFEDDYTPIRKVRKGDFATVWECKNNETHEIFAVKIIPRSALSTAHDELVLNEVSLLQSVSDDAPDSIVKLVDFYEEDDAFYMVMELLTGGDVFDRILKRSQYTERDARELMRQLLQAVSILHGKGIAHRDIKPHNLLLQSNHSDSSIKLCDFSFARRVHTLQSLTQRVGTPPYVAPEILKNIPHDERVDLWSVGVTMFTLLVGYPPFGTAYETREMVCQQIKEGAWRFDKEDWKSISAEAKELIEGLLQVDPAERLSASEALQSKWITQLSDETLSNHSLKQGLSTLKRKQSKNRNERAAANKTLNFITQAKNTLMNGGGFLSKPISSPTQAPESILEDSSGNIEVKV